MKYVVKSLKETEALAKEFANMLAPGDVVLLKGDLGAGKTTFVGYVLRSLGVREAVTSPTFSILKIYEGKFKFFHFDTYRISTEEAIEAGFDEILSEKEGVIFIEWSENILGLLPENCIEINIKYLNETTREFEFLNTKLVENL